MDKDSYLLELSRYIVLNPVRACMVKAAKAWPWSSYLSTIGQAKAPDFLDVEWLLSLFAKRKSTAIERYIQFVAEGKGQVSPWSMLKNQIYLGSEDFVEQMQSLVDGEKELSEVPSSQMRPLPKTLDYYEKQSNDRNSAIISGYRSGGYTLKELGDYFGLHYSTVSGIIKNHKS